MTSEACMLCGENHRFDDSMCYDCDTKQTWPESFIRRDSWSGSSMDADGSGGDWCYRDDVLWLVALWRLMQQVRVEALERKYDGKFPLECLPLEKVWRVLDKLDELEQEAKG